MNKDLVKLLSAELKTAADAIAAKHGLTVRAKGGSYSDTEFTARIGFEDANSGEATFKKYASLYDLKDDDFGTTFTARGRRYTVSGIAPTRRSKPILATRDDGKEFVFPVAYVLGALGRPAPGFGKH